LVAKIYAKLTKSIRANRTG